MKQKEKQLWILFGSVIASPHKTSIMKLIKERPLTPTQIQKETKLNLSHISKLLKGLREKGIVECLNPSQHKGKLYILTERGLWICNQLEQG